MSNTITPLIDRQTCNCCKGGKLLEMKVRDLSGKSREPWSWAIVGCHMCDSKGFITDDDRARVHNILNDYRPYLT